MLKLDLKREARWVNLLPGVRVKVEPVSSAVMLASRMDPGVLAMTAEDGASAIGAAVTKAVARAVIVEWDGVGDEDGKVIAVTPDGVDALLDIWPAFEAFQQKVMAPVLALESEKNA